MSEKSAPEFATCLPVIGRSLAYLCLTKAMESDGAAEKDDPGQGEFPGRPRVAA